MTHQGQPHASPPAPIQMPANPKPDELLVATAATIASGMVGGVRSPYTVIEISMRMAREIIRQASGGEPPPP